MEKRDEPSFSSRPPSNDVDTSHQGSPSYQFSTVPAVDGQPLVTIPETQDSHSTHHRLDEYDVTANQSDHQLTKLSDSVSHDSLPYPSTSYATLTPVDMSSQSPITTGIVDVDRGELGTKTMHVYAGDVDSPAGMVGLHTPQPDSSQCLPQQMDVQIVQIFCRVTAVLSDMVVQTLPLNKQDFFSTLLQETNIKCEVILLQTGQYAINGDIQAVLDVEKALESRCLKMNSLELDTLKGSASRDLTRLKEKNLNVERQDKGVNCELIQPSRTRARHGKGFYAVMLEGKADESSEDVEETPQRRTRGRPRRKTLGSTSTEQNAKECDVIGLGGECEETQQGGEEENTKENKSAGEDTLQQKKIAQKGYENDKPFKYFCKKCSFKTKRQSHFMKHLEVHRKHPNSKMFKCSQCDFTAMRKLHLRRHEIKHTDASQLLNCDQCQFTTFNQFHLNRHIKYKHDLHLKKDYHIYRCSECSYTTKFASHYERHIQLHCGLIDAEDEGSSQTPTNILSFYINKSFQCKKCSYVTNRKEHFVRHLKNVHTNRRPFLCDLCGKAFKRTDALSQHKLTHLERRDRQYRFSCPQCQKLFRSQAHLKEHAVMHTNVRAFLCEICGANFKTKAVQRKHMQTIHSNPRAHACPSCDKRFNTKYSLARHQRTHDTPGMRCLSEKVQEQQYGEVIVGNVVVEIPAANQEQVQHVVEIHAPMMQQDGTMADKLNETYTEHDADGLQQGYIQTNEASTALLYLTSNFQTY